MRQFLGGLLALVMVSTLGTVAFAADEPNIYIDASGDYYLSDREGRAIRQDGSLSGNLTVEPGHTLYVPLTGEDSTVKSKVERMNVFADWVVGNAPLPTIVYQKVYAADTREDEDGNQVDTVASLGYQYLVAIQVPNAGPTKAVDLCGTVKVARSASVAKKLDPSQYLELYLTAEYQEQSAKSSNYIIKNNDAPVLEFDEDGVVEIAWGEKDDVAVFEVNVTGQDNLNLAFDTKYNRTIAQKYDHANLDFLTFQQRPTFNKVGNLYIYGDSSKFLYEITPEGELKVPDYLYDNSFGAFRLRTRTLGSYVISDRKLGRDATGNVSSAPSSQASSTPAPGSSTSSYAQDPALKYNPDTGRAL